MAQHADMMRQNLADIESYANAMLGNLERGAGELPQWTNHVISTVRTHMHDVVHFLRHQAREGRQYGMSGRGQTPWYGQAGVQTTGKQFYAGDARPEGQRRYAGHGGADEIQSWLIEAAGWDDGTRRYGFVWESVENPTALSRKKHESRRYGVPGIPYPQRGWWGQGGVATADSPFLAGPRRYAGGHEPTSMARKNLRIIVEYARQAAGYFQHGAGIAPSWLEHKLSIAAGSMDSMGHWLDNEGVEGRKYGTHLNPSPEDAKTIAKCYGYADGLGDIYTGPKWEGGPYRGDYERAHREGVRDANRGDAQKLRAECYGKADGIRENYLGHLWDDSEHEDSYDRAWSEGFGAAPSGGENGQRLYGADGGGDGDRHAISAGGHRAGSGYQPHPRRRGRFWKKHPHRHVPYHPVWGYVPWMHPGNGIDHRTGFQTDIHLGEPEPVPHVTQVYAHMVREQLLPEIPDSHAVIGMLGSGFSAIDVPSMRIRYKLNGDWREDDAPITTHSDEHLEIALPISKQVAHSFELTDIGYFESGDFITISHSFFQVAKYPYHPFATRNYGHAFGEDDDSNLRKYALNLAQKFEGAPGPIRPHSQAEGLRIYGMTPGEAIGLQTPMGYVQRPWRSLSPGYGPVQEYGSMGYGSMGTGSMDRAVQQAMLQRTKGSRVP